MNKQTKKNSQRYLKKFLAFFQQKIYANASKNPMIFPQLVRSWQLSKQKEKKANNSAGEGKSEAKGRRGEVALTGTFNLQLFIYCACGLYLNHHLETLLKPLLCKLYGSKLDESFKANNVNSVGKFLTRAHTSC